MIADFTNPTGTSDPVLARLRPRPHRLRLREPGRRALDRRWRTPWKVLRLPSAEQFRPKVDQPTSERVRDSPVEQRSRQQAPVAAIGRGAGGPRDRRLRRLVAPAPPARSAVSGPPTRRDRADVTTEVRDPTETAAPVPGTGYRPHLDGMRAARGVPRRALPRRGRPLLRRVHRRRRLLRALRLSRHPGPAAILSPHGWRSSERRRDTGRRAGRMASAASTPAGTGACSRRRSSRSSSPRSCTRRSRPRPSSRRAVGAFKATFLYVANWYFIHQSSDYFAAAVNANPVQQFWSLAVEEQFYFVWPILLTALYLATPRAAAARPPCPPDRGRRWRSWRRRLWALHLASTNISRAYYGTDARAYQLLAGALLALSPGVLRRLRAVPRHVAGGPAARRRAGGAVDLGARHEPDPTRHRHDGRARSC